MQYEMIYPEYDLEYIDFRYSLREPQMESLIVLDKILKESDLLNQYELQALLKQIHEMYPTLSSFEREFPSLCFALATGVGKTRLMAAFITYLYTNYGIEHFFVLAPNLTIYNKLIRDFSDPAYEKYLFRGIDIFEQKPPRVVTGETYREQAEGQQIIGQSIEINIFNISKINAETRKGKEPQIKRLSEYIGQSYFDYLSKLKDLVLLMDESHHYRADRGMTVINELKPLFGLELTATPQVERASKTIKFKNVVYEYSLAKAITDNFVKQPYVATRVDFDPKKYQVFEIDRFKLIDGIRLHRNTKSELEYYAKTENKKLVKPFVLVVCKDTTHAGEVKEYIQSDDFFEGEYKDKVIEIHSNQTGEEKDETIQKLLNLESEDNTVEIVIHVNMLKEGWDVTNLYTIIPLRTAASTTLREQTIGRGLRLPYGQRTKNDSVNRLTIVAHDKFEEIIDAANEESSIIRKENIIDIGEIEDLEKDKEIISNQTPVEKYISEKQNEISKIEEEHEKKKAQEEIEIESAISKAIDEVVHVPQKKQTSDIGAISFFSFKQEEKSEEEKQPIVINKTEDLQKKEVIEEVTQKVVEALKKEQVSLFDKEPEKMIELVKQHYSPIVQQKIKSTIDIPEIAMIPQNEVTYSYHGFTLDTSKMDYSPVSEDILVESLKGHSTNRISVDFIAIRKEPAEKLIIGELINYPEIDYFMAKEVIADLINQVKEHFLKKYTEKETENIFLYRKKEIAKELYEQMIQKDHFIVEQPKFEIKVMNPVLPIIKHSYSKYKEDEIVDFHTTIPASELKKKVFGGFQKACHTEYKFDSEPELKFALLLERDDSIKKWIRPAPKQFKIWWRGGQLYEPDFVVETELEIYIVEIKANNRLKDEEVLLKAKAAYAFCENVNKVLPDRKHWSYMLLADNEINRNTTFDYLIKELNHYSYYQD